MLRPYRHRVPREFLQRQRPPAGAGERGHLPREDRAAHPSDAELERAADAVIAEDRSGLHT